MKPQSTELQALFSRHVQNLTGGEQAYGLCPFHPDSQRSFSIDMSSGLWTCHRGCGSGNAVQFAERLNLPADAVAGKTSGRRTLEREEVYAFRDETGELLFEEVRRQVPGRKRKRIIVRRPDGQGGYINNIEGVRRVLYRLPELLASAGQGVRTYIVEGPNKVDALRAIGLVATCNPLGAGKWSDDYAEFLRDRDLVVLPDNDKPGRRHAEKVALSARGVAKSILFLELPNLPYKGDVIDWLRSGGTSEKLTQLLQEAASKNLIDSGTPAPKTDGFFQPPNWPFTCGIWSVMTAREKALYPVLARRVDKTTRNCMTTLKDLARESGVYWRSISAVTDKLEERGLIRKTRVGNRAHYHLLMAPPASLSLQSQPKSKRAAVSLHEADSGRFVSASFD